MVWAPTCPCCGSAAAGPPDPLGVHRCGGCRIEFRPPLRVPLRHAGVTPARDSKGWMGVLVGMGVVVGITIAIGDSQAPGSTGAALDVPALRLPPPPSLELSGLELGSRGAAVRLEHELHISDRRGRELFMTGLIRNPSEGPVDAVGFELHALSASGAVLASFEPRLACPRMVANEACGWVLETEIEGVVSEFEFELRGVPQLGLALPRVDRRARFDARGERLPDSADPGLELSLAGSSGVVELALAKGTSLSSAWVSVTAFDGRGQVLSVALERVEAIVGRHRQALDIPQAEDAASFDVAVSGYRLDLDLGGSGALDLPDVELQPVELPAIELPPIEPPPG